MRTVGQLLKEKRLEKGFSLEQVERATKIRLKFLTAIEAGDYQKMPPLPYVQGFIKNYSDFLSLPSTTILALFRREFSEQKKQKKVLIEEPLTSSKWKLTPNKVILGLVCLLVVSLFSYFFQEYRALYTPPPLTLENPKNELVTKEEMVPVFGKTDPDATATINSEPILVKKDGKFYKDILLTLGSNTLMVTATNRVGAKKSLILHVTRIQ